MVIVNFRTNNSANHVIRYVSCDMSCDLTAGCVSCDMSCDFNCREFVIVLEPYVQPEEQFIRQLLSRPRDCYCKAGVEEWKRANDQRSLLIVLQDVREMFVS